MGTDPWYPLRILGFGLLLLLLAGVPTLVLAQPDQLAWEEHKTTHDAFLFLVGTITTIAGVQRLYSSLYKKKNDLDHVDLANMPPQGKNLGEFLNAYIMMFTGKTQTLQELREHNPTQRITPDANYNINKETREALTQTLWRVLDRFEELETIHEGHVDEISNVTEKLRDLMALPDEETLENMLQHTEELIKFAKGIKREFNTWFPQETNTTLDHVIQTLENYFATANQDADLLKTYQNRLNEIAMEMNFPPTSWVKTTKELFFDYLSPLSAVFETPPATLTPRQILLRIQDGITSIANEIPDKYKEHDAQGTLLIPKSIQGLRKAVHRMTGGMSGIKTHFNLMDESDSNALDSVIDQKYVKPHKGTGYTAQQLQEIIEEMQADLNTLGKQPAPTPGNCGHPEELARAVHFNPQTVSWADSLDEVTRLYNLSQQPQQGAPPAQGGQEESLFRASEAPEFKERKSYWSYRSSLNRFKSGILVKDVHRGLALNRILSRFTGNDVSDASNRWDLTPMINAYPTWETIYAAFLAELDRRFLSPDFAKQQEIKFRSLRSRDKEPQEFILDFETQVRTTQEALQLAGQRELENGEIMRQLLAVLPGDVRTKIYDKYDYPEGEDFFTLSPSIIRWWKNLPKNTTGNPKNTKKSGGNSNSGTPTAFSPGSPRKHPEWGTCNKPCWDTERIVPNGNRGKYQNIQRGKDLLCPHCRRGKTDHGGNPEGCQQHGQHQYHGNGSHSANPSGNDEGDH